MIEYLKNIECDKTDCLFQSDGNIATCMGWHPIYDKFGNLVNNDPNTYTYFYKCLTCRKKIIINKCYNDVTVMCEDT